MHRDVYEYCIIYEVKLILVDTVGFVKCNVEYLHSVTNWDILVVVALIRYICPFGLIQDCEVNMNARQQKSDLVVYIQLGIYS